MMPGRQAFHGGTSNVPTAFDAVDAGYQSVPAWVAGVAFGDTGELDGNISTLFFHRDNMSCMV